MKKFLLVDDHAIIRSSLKNIITETYGASKIYEAGSFTEAAVLLKERQYDLIIMDIQMSQVGAYETVLNIMQSDTDAKILIFSDANELIYAKKFMQGAVMGFLIKDAAITEIKRAIEMILNGKKYISSLFADFLLDRIDKPASQSPFNNLSPQEFNVASHIIQGISTTAISKMLNLGMSTISTYKGKIFEKLQVKNVSEIIELKRLYAEA